MFLYRQFIGTSLLCLMGVCVWLSSCDNDGNELVNNQNPAQEATFPGVNEALWPLFTTFEEEAAERGYNIDLRASGITGFIEEIEERHVAGRCNYNFRQPNRVTIDEQFWNRSSNSFREMIVFHELGHCYLFRDHDERILSNRACASIMRSGNESCIDNYNLRTREMYIDELFENSDRLQ